MSLPSLRLTIHNGYLAARQIDRLVESQEFADAYEVATTVESLELAIILACRDVNGLRTWMSARLVTALEDLPYIVVRDMAKAKRIPLYSRMSKDELITALEALRGTTSVGQRGEPADTGAAVSGAGGNSRAAGEDAGGPAS